MAAIALIVGRKLLVRCDVKDDGGRS